MLAQDFVRIVAGRIHVLLKPLHYRKRGLNFSCDRGEVIHLIQIQRSKKSTRYAVVLTLNLGAFSKLLSERRGQEVVNPRIPDCHWRKRIGHLIPDRYDKWWEIRSAEEAQAVGEELATLLLQYGLPALEGVSTDEELVRLWESGESPGLTEFERTRYLNLMKPEKIMKD
ncbi:MAG: DUF4304 domain-containing protein [Armatimonadetes bacterium]|nr:DUF4304 domain-containing protein [Armatimonadota bacterium]